MAEGKPARLGQYRPTQRTQDDYDEPDDAPADAPTGVEDDAWQDDDADEGEYDDGPRDEAVPDEAVLDDAVADAEPDVLLDVPVLKVEEIDLEVEDLTARVSLQADVLNLLKLHVGADVTLGRVSLGIKGVDAVAQLKVRLDQVATIIDRVMVTIDNNPEILTELTSGLGAAAREVGRGAGDTLGEVGEGAGSAVESVGGGVRNAAGELGRAAGGAVEDVIEDAGDVADDVVRSGRGAVSSAAGKAARPRRAATDAGDKPRRVRRPRPE